MPCRALMLLCLAACASARAVVDVPLVVSPVGETLPVGARTFTLTSAELSLAAIRFREPAPVVWTWPSWTPVAYAHPGHTGDAGVVGEWRGPVAVDLLAGGALGTAQVFDGEVASADLVGGAPTLMLTGSVTEGERTVSLSLSLTATEDVLGTSVGHVVSADAPPESWVLALDVPFVLGELADVELPASGTWAPQDDTVSNNLATFGLLRPASWIWKED